MLVMSSLLGVIVFALGALAALVIWLIWQMQRPNKAEAWPMAKGTIQSVCEVVVHAGNSYSVDVGDFSYEVNNEYFSGRLTISSSLPDGDRSPRGLIHQEIHVHYDPQRPERFSVPPQEVGGFHLGPYSAPNASNIDPIDLNIDKI